MQDRRALNRRRDAIGAPGAERRGRPRRADDLPGGRPRHAILILLCAGGLGALSGLALTGRGAPGPAPGVAAPPSAPAATATPRPRSADHEQIAAISEAMETLTPTDLLLDDGLLSHWILVAESVVARLPREVHPETEALLRDVERRLRDLGVLKTPTPLG